VVGALLRCLLVLLAACAIAPYVEADRFRLGIVLAYPPRLIGAALAAALALVFRARRAPATASVAATCAVLFLASASWSGAWLSRLSQAAPTNAAAAPELTLLSYNVHNQPAAAAAVADLVRREHVDIITLQEVRIPKREPFIATLPDFAFFWADPAMLPDRRSTGVFASMIGLRRDRFDDLSNATVATGITGYRTFAVRASVRGRPMWIVNVHATKPFWLEDGLVVFVTDAPAKARWHQEEAMQLSRWAVEHADVAAVFAGDFNAPDYARVMRLEGLHTAFAEVGRGVHVTFPTFLPVWGIDHVLGNRHVQFVGYRTLDPGPSDHLAQLARFRTRIGEGS